MFERSETSSYNDTRTKTYDGILSKLKITSQTLLEVPSDLHFKDAAPVFTDELKLVKFRVNLHSAAAASIDKAPGHTTAVAYVNRRSRPSVQLPGKLIRLPARPENGKLWYDSPKNSALNASTNDLHTYVYLVLFRRVIFIFYWRDVFVPPSRFVRKIIISSYRTTFDP